jgi:hypothetical protein
MIPLVSLAIVLIFILGELPLADQLHRAGSAQINLLDLRFFLFVATRLVGISGQIYLWSITGIGKVAALMGISGVLLSNFLGVCIFNQKPLPIHGYVGLAFAFTSFFLLAFSK